jgi:predicted  nucleic acid-binding Zn-ribbon protein
MTRTSRIRAEKETDPKELRRLVNWFTAIANDYRTARLEAVDAKDIGKMADLERLEQDARKRAADFQAQLRKAGHP